MKKLLLSACICSLALLAGAAVPDPPHMPKRLPKVCKTGGKAAEIKGNTVVPAFPGALIVWELPDAPGSTGPFIELVGCRGAEWKLRKFGATEFLWLRS